MSTIQIGSNITNLEDGVFALCDKLNSVKIEDGITVIPSKLFFGCSSLTNIIIPTTVTNIGKWAFSNCTNLESISLPNGITSTEESAFEGCSKLVNIHIPAGITNIGTAAFFNCKQLNTDTLKMLPSQALKQNKVVEEDVSPEQSEEYRKRWE